MKVTLTKLYRSKTKKDGTPLISKDGRPYEKLAIKCQEYGDKFIGGFSSSWNQHWKEGDTVDIEVEQNGEYLNFKKVDPVSSLALDVAKLRIDVAQLKESVSKLEGTGGKSKERIENPFANDPVQENPFPQADTIGLSDIPF